MQYLLVLFLANSQFAATHSVSIEPHPTIHVGDGLMHQSALQADDRSLHLLRRSPSALAEDDEKPGYLATPNVEIKTPSLESESEVVCSRNGVVPGVVWSAFESVALKEQKKLEAGAAPSARPNNPAIKGSVFEAVGISLPLAPPIIGHDPKTGEGQGDKNIVSLSLGREAGVKGKRCVVYGIGIADDSSFEQKMAASGCETHAFDCTVNSSSPVVKNKSFTFHNWCIGEGGGQAIKSPAYVNGSAPSLMQFKKLSETMKLLGHAKIDLLKFDIEGFEWPLFQTEILTASKVPEQLSFELHTEMANPAYVPQKNVKGKGYKEVNTLFLQLYNKGYRVVSKELNDGDPACAEFVVVNVL